MKTKPTLALRAGLLFASVSLPIFPASAGQPVPVILRPTAGSTATTSPVDIRVSVSGIWEGNFLRIVSDGKALGYAKPLNCIGEWPFPDGSHLSVMDNAVNADIIVDYHPPGGGPMFFFDGAFSSKTRFAGTFTHWNGVDPDPLTGNVTVDFSFTSMGLLNAKISGDSPLGTHTSTGAWSETTTYQFLWNDPPDGGHTLTAVANWTDQGTSQSYNFTSSPVAMTVRIPRAPEIDVEQPKGKRLVDGKGSTNFGKVKVGGKATKTYVIRNTGNADLRNLKIKLKGRNKKDFVVSKPKASSLGAGGKTVFKVKFQPKTTGLRAAALEVRSNDANENPFDIKLKGKGK